MARPAGTARPSTPGSSSWSRREVAFAVISVAAYLGAAVWARYVSIPGPVLVWFPPAGVAIGVLYLRPRLFPALVVAEIFSTAVIMDLAQEFGPVALGVNAVVIVGAYHLAGEALRQLHFDPRLRSSDDLVILAFACIVVGSTVAAVAGVLVQTWVGLVDADDLLRSIGLFWVGDVIGCACLTPAVVMVGSAALRGETLPMADDEHGLPRGLLVAEFMVAPVAAVVLMVVGDSPMQFTYLAFVPVVALAVRHGVAAAALSSAALGAVLTAGAHQLIDDPLIRSDVQLLMVVLTLTGIMVGAVVSARRDVLEAKEQISDVVEATPDLVATADRDGTVRYLNPCGRALLGIEPDAPVTAKAFDFLPDDLAVDLMREGMKAAERHGSWMGENRLRRADGRIVPVSQVLVCHRNRSEGTLRFSTVCRDMTDQRALEDQLRQAALYDDVTGLPNRALLEDQLVRLLHVAERPTRTAVMFADVDHLQRVNESFGFATGDRVVQTIAVRLSRLVRGADLLARYGGAQFVLVLPDVSDEFDAILLANRMLDSFSEAVDVDGRKVRVTGSIGITLAENGHDHDTALRRAEIALHRAKEAGGGRVAVFDQDLEARARQRMDLEADLREVLDHERWWLAYQPIVDATTGRVTSAEALLRWTHPERGPVAPYELIRLAEHSGAIVDLGRSIFAHACREAVQWHRDGHGVDITVNVSALQLRDPGFVRDVDEVIAATGIDPATVVVELTETVLAADEHGEIATLAALRSQGIRIAMDDFGTGFSSLSTLRDLPIDIVKLDRSFTTQLTTSADARATVEAAVGLAHALRLTVVAEGVETQAQADTLVALGCHKIQGYLVSHPLGPDDLTAFLGSHGTRTPHDAGR
jgi:diguanylate cyclase (GGDEF)-like protein/PAS domain S-box-containing protein